MDAPAPSRPLDEGFDRAPPILETEATVLRIHPFSHTSHMVVWLTEDGRRLVTSIKGAMRPKSAFLGQYDLFYACDLLYYAKQHDGVHIARECEALRRRDHLRDNWRAEHCASWFAALADLAADSGMATPTLYRLFDETLDVLDECDGAPPPAVFARFEAQLLVSAGLRPNFSPCPLCGAEDDGRTLRFNLADGNVHCPVHALPTPGMRSPPIVRITRETIDLFNLLADSPSIGPESTLVRTTPARTHSLLRFLGLFLQYHLPDAPLDGRAIAIRVLDE